MSNKFRYENILLYSSLQFTGNIEEYFSENTEKLVSYIIVPRSNYKNNLVRLYRNGKLVSEHAFTLSQNVFIYYMLILYYQMYFLFKYFGRGDKIFVITFHPVSLFGMRIQKLLRNIVFVYWMADYFPPVNKVLIVFERIKKFYNSRVDYVCYLSDIINQILNDKVINSSTRKTVMWGIIPRKFSVKKISNKLEMLFVGVIRESQGLEFLFEYLKGHRESRLNIIGDCDPILYKKYLRLIKRYNISKCVYFPNRFYSLKELHELSQHCHIGVALYDTDKSSATYYTDPGKVKTYTQLGLPVIMSNTSAIASYIAKYSAGLVIDKAQKDFTRAVGKIQNNYNIYVNGVKKFNGYFSYDGYYGKSFRFMEDNE